MIQLACKGLRTLKRLGLFLATAKLAATCGGAAAAAEPPATPAPLYHEATNEFARMKVTQYRHATRIDAAAGSYYYDCVGFVSHALHKAAPQAWKSLATKTALAPHHTPSPSMYRTFLAGLAAHVDLDGALLLLASDAGSYITGATIVADGGQVVMISG